MSHTSRPEAEITEIIFPVQLSPDCDNARLQRGEAEPALRHNHSRHDYPLLFMQLKNKTARMQGIPNLPCGSLLAPLYSGG